MKSSARHSLEICLAAVIVIASLVYDRSVIGAIVALFVLVVPFEKLFPRHAQKLRRPRLATDVGYALASPLLQGAGLVVGIAIGVMSLAWLPGLLLRPLVAQLPGVVATVLAFALFDLAIYWTHRLYHEIPILWRFHAVHHSTTHLDWVSGFRNHPLDGALIAPAIVFLIAAGFDPDTTGVIAVLQLAAGIFLHANVRWRLRPLHRLVITPEFHHWHHTNEPEAVNKNHSTFLPLWDILFGTFYMPADRRPSIYGVDEPVPDGMLGQLRYPFTRLGSESVVPDEGVDAEVSGGTGEVSLRR